jgi:hypothetical protein
MEERRKKRRSIANRSTGGKCKRKIGKTKTKNDKSGKIKLNSRRDEKEWIVRDIEAIQLSLSALFAMPRLQVREEGNLLIASVTSRNEVEKKIIAKTSYPSLYDARFDTRADIVGCRWCRPTSQMEEVQHQSSIIHHARLSSMCSRSQIPPP